jgi:hypothetical protein
MKSLSKIFGSFILLAALALTGCTKVIDLDLNTADPQIVVEADLSDKPSEKATVSLSKTINFSQNNTFPPLSNAVVFIKNRTTGVTDTLKETSAGLYKGTKLVGVVGNTYDLTIQSGGKTITASSTIPRKVPFDTIAFIRQALFGNERISMIPRFNDPVGVGDNYRYIVTTNGKKATDLHIQNDALIDGKVNGRPLFTGGGGPPSQDGLKVGDVIDFEFRCIDKGAYTYFETLQSGGGGPNSNSATPTNPVSNLNGAILGYFSAYTTQTKTIIVK